MTSLTLVYVEEIRYAYFRHFQLWIKVFLHVHTEQNIAYRNSQ